VAAVLRLPRAELAWHQAEVGFDLVRVAEALGVIEGGDECGGGHRPDAGDRAQVKYLLKIDRLCFDGQSDEAVHIKGGQ
jgi:hypothetical protein